MNPEPISPLDQRIEDVDFRTKLYPSKQLAGRVRNGLQRVGIFTIGELVDCTKAELESFDHGLGVVSMLMIEAKLKSMKLRFRRIKMT